ncbi:hypothetical protein [Clostridium sp.]
MRNLNKICCLFLVSIIMFSFVSCSPNVSEDASAEKIITEYVTTYYTITKEASEGNYTVSLSNVKLEKDSEDEQTKTYYYDIELIQTSISGNKVKGIKDKKQITVSKVKDSWKVSNSYTYGY